MNQALWILNVATEALDATPETLRGIAQEVTDMVTGGVGASSGDTYWDVNWEIVDEGQGT